MFHINLAWNSAKQLQNRTSGKEQTCSNEAVITQSPGHANSCCNVLWLLLLAELADLQRNIKVTSTQWSSTITYYHFHLLSAILWVCHVSYRLLPKPDWSARMLSKQSWVPQSQHHKRWNTTKKARCSSVTTSFVHCISTPGFLQIASNCAYTLALYFSRCVIFCHQFARCLFVAA